MIIGIDLGSARTAATAARSSMPLHIAAAHVVDVNPDKTRLDDLDVEPAVEEVLALIDAARPEQVVIEHRGWYMAKDKSGPAQMAMQQHWLICDRQNQALLKGLYDRGFKLHDYKASDPRALPKGAIYVIGRQSWACRAVPHTKGGITDAMAWEGLLPHIADGAELLDTQDKRDAAGVLLRVLLPAPKKHRARRAAAPREKPSAEEREAVRAARRVREAARVAHARGGLSAAERAGAGCRCGKVDPETGERRVRKHRDGCALATRRRVVDPLDVALGLA